MAVALGHINLQEAGEYREVTPAEKVRLKDFIRMSWKMTEFSGYQPRENSAIEDYIAKLEIWSNGGGVVYRDLKKSDEKKIPRSVRLGVGQMIQESYVGTIGENSTLNHTNVCKTVTCYVGDNFVSIYTQFYSTADGSELRAGSDVSLVESSINSAKNEIGNRVTLNRLLTERSNSLKIQGATTISKSTFKSAQIVVGQNSVISDSKIINDGRDTLLRFGNNVNIRGLEMSFQYRDSKIIDNPVGMMVSAAVLLYTLFTPMIFMSTDKNMHFLDGFTADLTGQKLCPEGQSTYTVHMYDKNFDFPTLDRLREFCGTTR